LEGIDGSGKSTALLHIASRLKEIRPEIRLCLSAEPTSSPEGLIIRRRLSLAGEGGRSQDRDGVDRAGVDRIEEDRSEAFGHDGAMAAERMNELFLFFADHAWHLARTVIPALSEGDVILCDRYADSTAAYQGVTLREILPDPVAWIQSILRAWNRAPDLTLLFLIDPHAALLRMQSRSGREKFERLEFLKLVDENFRKMAAAEPNRFALIDAEKPEEQVAEDCIAVILARLSL